MSDPAEALARKMAMTAWSLVDGTGERMLPYARALLQAEKALGSAVHAEACHRANWDLGDGCAYDHPEGATCPGCDCGLAAALAALRAVIGEP